MNLGNGKSGQNSFSVVGLSILVQAPRLNLLAEMFRETTGFFNKNIRVKH